jgi:WD40 repeat protein
MSCYTNAGKIMRAAGNLGFVALFLVLSSPLSVQESKEQATFEGHTKAVRSLCFSPDGKTLASGSDDHSIILWDVVNGRNTNTLKEEDPYLWTYVAFSPDGKMLATGGWFNKVKLWDVVTLKGKVLLDEGRQCPGTLIVFSPDGKTLASGGVCRSDMELFDVATGEGKALVTLRGFNLEGVLAMGFTPDSKVLVSVGRRDGVKLWDAATGKNTATLKTASIAHSAAVSSSGKLVATAVYVNLGERHVAKDIKVWVVATSKEQVTLQGHTLDVLSLAFDPEGQTLASGCEDGTIKLWDVASGKELATLKGHTDKVWSLAFSKDGKVLASGSEDKTIKLWEIPKTK